MCGGLPLHRATASSSDTPSRSTDPAAERSATISGLCTTVGRTFQKYGLPETILSLGSSSDVYSSQLSGPQSGSLSFPAVRSAISGSIPKPRTSRSEEGSTATTSRGLCVGGASKERCRGLNAADGIWLVQGNGERGVLLGSLPLPPRLDANHSLRSSSAFPPERRDRVRDPGPGRTSKTTSFSLNLRERTNASHNCVSPRVTRPTHVLSVPKPVWTNVLRGKKGFQEGTGGSGGRRPGMPCGAQGRESPESL